MKITNIIFDIHDVLIDFDYRAAYPNQKLSVDEAKKAISNARALVRKYLLQNCPLCSGPCKMPRAEKISHMVVAGITGINLDESIALLKKDIQSSQEHQHLIEHVEIVSIFWVNLKFLEHMARPIKETSILIQHLKKIPDLKFFVFSNASRQWFNHLNKNILNDHFTCFSGITLSGDIKILKPNPQAVDIFLKTHALKPNECLMIDDKQENISIIEQFGMHGITFDHNKFNELVQKLIEHNVINKSTAQKILEDVFL